MAGRHQTHPFGVFAKDPTQPDECDDIDKWIYCREPLCDLHSSAKIEHWHEWRRRGQIPRIRWPRAPTPAPSMTRRSTDEPPAWISQEPDPEVYHLCLDDTCNGQCMTHLRRSRWQPNEETQRLREQLHQEREQSLGRILEDMIRHRGNLEDMTQRLGRNERMRRRLDSKSQERQYIYDLAAAQREIEEDQDDDHSTSSKNDDGRQ
jgi:hypothetical protein